MEEKKLWALARLTFGLVLVMGVVTTGTLLRKGPLASDLPLPPSQQRAPASVISVAASGTDEVISKEIMSTLDLHCLKPGAVSLKSQSRQVRLLAQVCTPETEIVETHVRNKSNGFEATIFETGEKAFSTDYIYLSDGPNEIELSYLTKSGEKLSSELLVHRQNTFVLDGKNGDLNGSRSSQVE